jgi:hypothetical protein
VVLSAIGSLSLGIFVSLAISIFYAALPLWGNREIIRRLAVYEFFVAAMPHWAAIASFWCAEAVLSVINAVAPPVWGNREIIRPKLT